VTGVQTCALPIYALANIASKHASTLTQLNVDLGDAKALMQAVQALKPLISGHDRVRFIHNAGIVTPIAQAENLNDLEVINHAFQVNITSAMVLTAAVLTASGKATDRRIMLISSGAGRNASSGWGVYCATKAAMDRYAEAVKLDVGERARITSMAPGVIDTDMQVTIRSTPKEALPSLDRFLGFHQNKQLGVPDTIARRILAALESDTYGATIIDDIRQYPA
jgi:NADP-dependent 3-hydroxy acid dehydrogenase YdfG